jgi:hypothetical protein
MFKIIIFFIALFMFANVQAQTSAGITGVIKTEDAKPITKANILLYYIGEKDTLKTISNNDGFFSFKDIAAKKLAIIVTHVGFEKIVREIYPANNIENIVLIPAGELLETVTVESTKMVVNEDTVSYKIDSSMYRNNDNVEELLKNLAGIEVDREGNVTANGELLTMVKVNGIEFFGGDVKTAIKQLNAEMVDKNSNCR